MQYTALASGSAGNASLLEVAGFGLLVDAGLGPRQLGARLAAVGASWQRVQAVILSHTHSDHWKDRTLAHLQRRQIPLYCHPEHHGGLRSWGFAFGKLEANDLVRSYEAGKDLVLSPSLRCRPVPLRHDSGATFGFRFEGSPDLYGHRLALGYAADLGSWTPDLVEALADVDLLALEFNHDVQMEYASGRSPSLIARVLGEEGHLSNEQAATLLGDVLCRSSPGRLQGVVQLHLSRDCNTPGLAAAAAREVLAELSATCELHTAHQDVPLPTLALGLTSSGSKRKPSVPRVAARGRRAAVAQDWLPGWQDSAVV